MNRGVTVRMMFNRSITLDSLTVWASWSLGLILAIGDMFEFMPEDCGYVGIALVGLGIWIGTLRAITRLEEREQVAFRLGRETGLRAIR